MTDQEKERLARLGYCVSASCVVPGLLQGWMGLDPATGSYDTEEEAWEAISKAEARLHAQREDSLGLMHDRVHKDVGRSRIARTARNKHGSTGETDDKAMLELLLRCRPFVWRAMQGGKSPHAQDKEDAKQLWPLIKDLKK